MLFGGKKKQRPRKSLSRPSRVPLTYYKSAKNEPAASPFKPINKKPKSRRIIPKVTYLLLISVLFLGLIYSLLVSAKPRIIASSLSYRPQKSYEEAAAANLAKLKNRTKLTFDEKDLVNSLKKQFPEISSATVELPLFSHVPVIRLNVAAPSFVLKNSDTLYVIDSEGKVVGRAANFPQAKNLPALTDVLGSSASLGKQVISSSSVTFIETLILQLKHGNVPVGSLELPQAAQELRLRTADRPYFVKFYLDGDPLRQSGQFLAARHNFDSKGQQPAEYLDVRIPGRIFYK